VRVISGKAGGLRLKTLDGLKTRPTADRIKESLFNIINLLVNKADVLDLFAGSGALGIESLSRGAKFTTFIDNNKESIAVIKSNLLHTGLEQQSEVYQTDFETGLKKLKEANRKYNIIFLDPPYGKGLEFKAIEEITKHKLLKTDGVIILENEQKDDLPQEIAAMVKTDTRNYGRTSISFYKLKGEKL
jgi:16S rRNA (guanine(966)-N(2))-methyltransferase RsmD